MGWEEILKLDEQGYTSYNEERSLGTESGSDDQTNEESIEYEEKQIEYHKKQLADFTAPNAEKRYSHLNIKEEIERIKQRIVMSENEIKFLKGEENPYGDD